MSINYTRRHLQNQLKLLIIYVFCIASPRAARIVEASRPFISEHSLKTTHVFGNNKTEWSPVLLSQIPADQLFIAYGGTRSVKLGTKRIELAV